MSAAVDILGSVEIVRDGDFPAASVKQRHSSSASSYPRHSRGKGEAFPYGFDAAGWRPLAGSTSRLGVRTVAERFKPPVLKFDRCRPNAH